MKVLIFPSTEAAVGHVADTLCDVLIAQPASVLGLATGTTMERVYARLVTCARARRVDVGSLRSFNLDEYCGLGPDHPASFAQYMATRFVGPLGLAPGQVRLPDGLAADPQAEADRYEADIAAAGGIDLQVLGIGQNGHIGFNEPTSSLGSRTRIKTLTASTRAANRAQFAPHEEMPRQAITMGIATILAARACLVLATGAAKAEAVAAMVEGPVTAMCPASALQMHRRATVVLDPEAAGRLRLCAYYQAVHPDGPPAR